MEKVEITVSIEPEDIKRQIEKSVMKSDLIQDKVDEIMESDDVREVLTSIVKRMLQTEKFDAIISKVVAEFITDTFVNQIDESSDIINALNTNVINMIEAKFKE